MTMESRRRAWRLRCLRVRLYQHISLGAISVMQDQQLDKVEDHVLTRNRFSPVFNHICTIRQHEASLPSQPHIGQECLRIGKLKQLTGLLSVDSNHLQNSSGMTRPRFGRCSAVGAKYRMRPRSHLWCTVYNPPYDTLSAHLANGFDTAPDHVGGSSRRARTR
jgi:hypothetical protein